MCGIAGIIDFTNKDNSKKKPKNYTRYLVSEIQ